MEKTGKIKENGEAELAGALDFFLNDALERMILSNPGDPSVCSRIRLRPMLLKERLVFQAEEQVGKQAVHKNLTRDEALGYLKQALAEGRFRQGEIWSELGRGTVLVSRKGRITVKVQKTSSTPDKGSQGREVAKIQLSGRLSHNRKKRYILE